MDIFETDRARIKRRLQAGLPILLLAAVWLIYRRYEGFEREEDEEDA